MTTVRHELHYMWKREWWVEDINEDHLEKWKIIVKKHPKKYRIVKITETQKIILPNPQKEI